MGGLPTRNWRCAAGENKRKLPSFLHVHSSDDRVIPIDGNAFHLYTPLSQAVAQLAAIERCNKESMNEDVPSNNTNETPSASTSNASMHQAMGGTESLNEVRMNNSTSDGQEVLNWTQEISFWRSPSDHPSRRPPFLPSSGISQYSSSQIPEVFEVAESSPSPTVDEKQTGSATALLDALSSVDTTNLECLEVESTEVLRCTSHVITCIFTNHGHSWKSEHLDLALKFFESQIMASNTSVLAS